MCGRFTMTASATSLAEHFDVAEPASFEPRFNIAPTQEVWSVERREGARIVVPRSWGLVPSWAKSAGGAARMINARVETVAEKPAFREAFRARRCLLPADGFYEWRAQSRDKQPYHIRLPDRALFAFAGLFEHWSGAGGEVASCTIVTTEAKGALRGLHHRMPVMLPKDRYEAWLDPEAAPASLRGLMETDLFEGLELRAVGRRVNSIRYDDLACLEDEAQLSLLPDAFDESDEPVAPG